MQKQKQEISNSRTDEEHIELSFGKLAIHTGTYKTTGKHIDSVFFFQDWTNTLFSSQHNLNKHRDNIWHCVNITICNARYSSGFTN